MNSDCKSGSRQSSNQEDAGIPPNTHLFASFFESFPLSCARQCGGVGASVSPAATLIANYLKQRNKNQTNHGRVRIYPFRGSWRWLGPLSPTIDSKTTSPPTPHESLRPGSGVIVTQQAIYLHKLCKSSM
jgi:hypothetical protein